MSLLCISATSCCRAAHTHPRNRVLSINNVALSLLSIFIGMLFGIELLNGTTECTTLAV